MTRGAPNTTIKAARPSAAPKVVCRQIRDDDLESIAALLRRGFPERPADYWRRGLHRLRDRFVPDGYPRYGYLMTAGGAPVGLVLLIFSRADDQSIRANVSSWFVEPAYRAYSGMLLAPAFRMRDVTFLNISPSPGTIETIAAQGFACYVDGTFHAAAALGRRVPGAFVRRIAPDSRDAPPLLVEHARCGCISLEVTLGDAAHPFVLVPFRSFRDRLPTAQLVYCRSVDELVRFAGPIGRHLARLGLPTVMLDANGPIEGLVGRYSAGRRLKFYRGPSAPRLCDLSATELVYLGP